jgi:rubrerythrin
MLIVDLRESDPELRALMREAEDSELEGGMVAAGRSTKGKRAEYRCAGCGYGIIVYGQPPSCPLCREPRWEHVEWRPFSQLLDQP